MIYIKVRVLEVRISLFSNHTLKNNAQLSGRAAVGHTVTDLEAAHKKYILHRKTLIFKTLYQDNLQQAKYYFDFKCTF